MYCGGCFRDNALVTALRKLGHNTAMIPLYLPMTLDEEDQSRGMPIFFGGINVYLEQKLPFFSRMPGWLHRLLDSPGLLGWAAGSAAKTRPEQVGELTLSMLRGEEGRQKRELDELVGWMKDHYKPDVICLSNVLLIGMVRQLKRELDVPIVCLLGGEDYFVDSLSEPSRSASWRVLTERAREVDCFAPPTQYYAELMADKLGLEPERVKVVPNGILLDGYAPCASPPDPPVLGFFARMCKEKGLNTLVEAFIQLKQRDRIKGLQLRIGGGMTATDEERLVNGLRERLRQSGFLEHVEFCPNLTREEKVEFYRSLSVLSVPALFGEAFGLYLAEAWAAGVPVVQPRHASFPELVEQTEAGLLCEPDSPSALADGIEQLLLRPGVARKLGQAGRQAALERFNIDLVARQMASVFVHVKERAALKDSFEAAAQR